MRKVILGVGIVLMDILRGRMDQWISCLCPRTTRWGPSSGGLIRE
jgi:hypothetical protein